MSRFANGGRLQAGVSSHARVMPEGHMTFQQDDAHVCLLRLFGPMANILQLNMLLHSRLSYAICRPQSTGLRPPRSPPNIISLFPSQLDYLDIPQTKCFSPPSLHIMPLLVGDEAALGIVLAALAAR